MQIWLIPVGERGAFELGPFAGVDPALAVQRQVIGEFRHHHVRQEPRARRYDAKYLRDGVGHLPLFYAPFENWRKAHVADNHNGVQRAHGVRHVLEERYLDAERITLVMDNQSTHTGS